MARRSRLDAELVRRGHARSRAHAAELIAAGRVRVAGTLATKAATQVGVGLWGATPAGGSLTENLQPVPAGPVCLSVWQFDRGYNFAQVPSTVMVTGTGAGPSARTTDLPPRVTAASAVTRFD